MSTFQVGAVTSIRARQDRDGLIVSSINVHGFSTLVVFTLPGPHKARLQLLKSLREGISDAIEEVEALIVTDNLRDLQPLPPSLAVVSGEQTEVSVGVLNEGTPQAEEITVAKLARCRCSTPHLQPADCPEYSVAVAPIKPRDPDGEAIARSLERENAFFTRTQGWDPRGDGPDKSADDPCESCTGRRDVHLDQSDDPDDVIAGGAHPCKHCLSCKGFIEPGMPVP